MNAINMIMIRREEPDDGAPQPEGQTRCCVAVGVGTLDGKILLSLGNGPAAMIAPLDYQTAELVHLAMEKALEDALLADPDQVVDDLVDEDLDSDDFDPPAEEVTSS